MKQKLVVIGNGMAGMRAVEELLNLNSDAYEITVFGAEPYGNYNRILLTPLLFGSKTLDQIMIHDFDWYQQRQISLHCGDHKTVVAIDRQLKQVIAKDGSVVDYDRLLIATGSLPTMLKIPGAKLHGVMGFRDIADVESLINASQIHQRATIVGGGLLGLEAANALQQRGMQVTVINRASHILNRQLDQEAGKLLQRHLQNQGIQFRLNTTVAEIVAGDAQQLKQIKLNDGSLLETDLVVMAMGIQPNIKLAKQAGLDCEQGIVVNDQLQTSDASIYAVGECIQHRGEVFGLVAPVYEQAKVCAQHLAGDSQIRYQSRLSATILKVTGIDLFSVGVTEADSDCEQQLFVDAGLGVYRKLILKNQQLVGAMLYGDTQNSGFYMKLISENQPITAFRDNLLFGPAEVVL
jgi:nitrite reductase (NADH) large subunit